MIILFSSLSIPIILQTTLAQTDSSLTYENPTYGFRIQYPTDWNVTEDVPFTSEADLKVVEFRSPDRASLSIDVENTNQYLDTNTLTLKSRTAQDYVSERIATQSNIPYFTFKYIIINSKRRPMKGIFISYHK
jgi:hypothetical protein